VDDSKSSTLPARRQAWKFLVPAGIAEVLLLAALGWWPGATLSSAALLLFSAAFVVYAVAASRVLDAVGGDLVIWVVAIALRLVFLPLTPELSDEVYRYLWDGHVQLSGVNPYLHAPADPALAEFHTGLHGLIDNQDAPTIYPPFAQMAFLVIALAGGAVLQAKLLWLGFDLATGWLLGRVARITGRSRRLTQLLYLWSPLLVVEVAWSGHLEPLGLFGIVLLILLARAPHAAGAAGALSALTRLAPLAALPPLARRLGPRFLLGFGVVFVGGYLPYAGAGTKLFTGLGSWAGHGRFMEGPFSLLESALPGPMAPRYAAAALVLGVVVWTTLKRFRPERALFWVLGAGMLLTPTLHPWYVLWMLPLAALRVSRPWLLFTGLAFLGYAGLAAYQETGIWPEPTWARLVLWLPLVALLVAEGAELWRARVPEPMPLTERRKRPRPESS
jgi:hypothetical protein